MGPPAPHRPNVACRGRKRRLQDRDVELRVVGEDADYSSLVHLGRLQELVRPGHHDLVGGRETLATSSILRCPRGPKWIVPVRPPSSIPRAASTTARSRSSLPAVPAWASGVTRSLPPKAGPSISVATATGDCVAKASRQRARISPFTSPPALRRCG